MLKVELEKKLKEKDAYIASLLAALQTALDEHCDKSKSVVRLLAANEIAWDRVADFEQREKEQYRERVTLRKEAVRLNEVIEDLKYDLDEGLEEMKAQREIFFKGLVGIKAASELTHEALNLKPLPRS